MHVCMYVCLYFLSERVLNKMLIIEIKYRTLTVISDVLALFILISLPFTFYDHNKKTTNQLMIYIHTYIHIYIYIYLYHSVF